MLKNVLFFLLVNELSPEMMRPHSAIIRNESSMKNLPHRAEHTPNNLNSKKSQAQGSKPFENEREDNTNSLDGILLEHSPKQVVQKGRKPSIFANRKPPIEGIVSDDDKSRRRSTSLHIPYSFGKRSSVLKQQQERYDPNVDLNKLEEDLRKIDAENEPEPIPETAEKQLSEAESSRKNDLQIIKEEKTIEYNHKISEIKNQSSSQRTPLKPFRLTGETFIGLLLESSSPEIKQERIEEDVKETEEARKNSQSYRVTGSGHRRANSMMPQPKILETDNIEILTTSKILTEPMTANKMGFKLEDIKLSDSLVVPNGMESRESKNELDPKTPNVLTPQQMNISHDITGNWGIGENQEKGRYQQISNQIDLIANETLRIIEEIHKKRRNLNKSDKG